MPHPSIGCLVRGELRKIALQRTNWVLPLIGIALGVVAAHAAGDSAPYLGAFQLALDTYRAFAAAAIGAIVLGVSAQLVAAEYHWGTIRVVTARGVGRFRLLGAKLAAVTIVAIPLLVLLGVGGAVDLAIHLAQRPAPVLWPEIWPSALVVLLSTAACAVLGAASGVVGRSMTFAVAIVAGFFPADNILGYVLPLIQNATQEQVWANLTTYLLGPTLNQLPAVLMGRPTAQLVGPQVAIDATHGLLVIAGYLSVLAAAAVISSRRDITN